MYQCNSVVIQWYGLFTKWEYRQGCQNTRIAGGNGSESEFKEKLTPYYACDKVLNSALGFRLKMNAYCPYISSRLIRKVLQHATKSAQNRNSTSSLSTRNRSRSPGNLGISPALVTHAAAG